MIPMTYKPWPGMERSALLNVVETLYGKSEIVTYRASTASRALIERFAGTCKNQGIAFVLAGTGRDGRTVSALKWAADRGMKSVNIAADLTKPENVLSDKHPNARAHVEMAEALEPAVLQGLNAPPAAGNAL
jgi:hypothetical protein